MKLAIILNTSHPETAWNALRLGNQVLVEGHESNIFLLGSGVETENIRDKRFNVAEVLKTYLDKGGNLLACGTCLKVRPQESGVCPVSTMPQLVHLIADSDKVVTFG